MSCKGIDGDEITNIISIASHLAEEGQRDLSLDLLIRSIQNCEQTAEKSGDNERLKKLRTKLEKKYTDIQNKKSIIQLIGIGFIGKVIIVCFAILFTLMLGTWMVTSYISLKLNKLGANQITELVKKSFDQIKNAKIPEKLSDLLNKNRTLQLKLSGIFTQNPAVHFQLSFIKENEGDISGALHELNLALALVEPDKEAYKKRIEYLTLKLKK